MGLSYLGGKTWLDVTREERLFCSHLYHDIRTGSREHELIRWLTKQDTWRHGASPDALAADRDWEVAYEVCFYRDLLNSLRLGDNSVAYSKVDSATYPRKRTFDLCLFSEECIVIFEAKVHERFNHSQVKSILKDKMWVEELAAQVSGEGKKPAVIAIALASSTYFKNVQTFGQGIKALLDEAFDARITWQGLYELLGDGLYLEADRKYPRSNAKKELERRRT